MMNSSSVEKQYFTIHELSEVIPISVSTIRRRIREGKIPSTQLGGKRTRHLIPASFLTEMKAQKSEQRHDSEAPVQVQKPIAGSTPRWMNSPSSLHQKNKQTERNFNA